MDRRAGTALAALAVIAAAACGSNHLTATAGTSSTSTAPSTVSPTTSPARTVTAVSAPPCVARTQPDGGGIAPEDLRAAVAAKLADPRIANLDFGISVDVGGFGEIVSHQPDELLLPASNQKLWTAAGVHAVLPPDFTFRTTIQATGPVAGGVLQGDLVVVGGGDPTLTTSGPHSLDSIAATLRQRGIETIAGKVVIDETHYDTTRTPAGWLPEQMQYVGPISAFMVDWNNVRKQADFMNDPTRTNGALLVTRLAKAGVVVTGGVDVAPSPPSAVTLFTVDSATRHGLVKFMLSESDNMMAESFVREIGFRRRGVGSTPAGLQAIDDAIATELCLPKEGINDDGSGVSNVSRHSAHYWRHLLEAARAQWGDEFFDELGVSGQTGTMKTRLADLAGKVHAKTGTVKGGRALSGYASTGGGRSVVFSIIGNGDDTQLTTSVIDELVTTVVGYPG